MKFICRHWYNIGLIPGIIAVIYLITGWNNLDTLVKVQLLSFIAIIVHQFEEYGFPGREPAIMNLALQGSDIPDRYPLNQFSAMFTNCVVTYTMYLLPIFFPNIIWLGLAPILMGVVQLIPHAVMTNIKMKSIYNPGLGAVVFLHTPIAIYYINYITSNNLVTGNDWLFGIIYLILVAGLIVGFMTYKVLPNRNTKYIFAEEEMKRFNVKEKMGL